ncbi:transmembrane protein 225 [Choloepus didactylus]|uniref:transmembrane protein 225 n=1 Tax=Choloepus didactylus TaxID=27675 RepID=UPI0018A05C1D|nr:transmembrane protein 225 [Choloepus didactylus]
MVHLSSRIIQTTNTILSSLALVFSVIGIIEDKWVELNLETRKTTINHSPWMVCCTTIWPEDDLEVIRTLMILTLILSFLFNLIQGMEFTEMIPQTKYMHLFTAFFSFLTGILLLSAFLYYYHKLRQGQGTYFSRYKVTWIHFTVYVNFIFYVICGIFCLLHFKQSIKSLACLNTIHVSVRERSHELPPGTSIQVISTINPAIMPRSIVRAHSIDTKEDVKPPSMQARRVTWAL